jgi:hypothetical protein
MRGVSAEPHDAPVVDGLSRGRPCNDCVPKPIAPFSRDPDHALGTGFDRDTGESVDPEEFKTYSEALAQYHLSCEAKFANGQFLDRGRTERRHVVAMGIAWIGEEANQVGESGECEPIRSAVEHFKKANGT